MLLNFFSYPTYITFTLHLGKNGYTYLDITILSSKIHKNYSILTKRKNRKLFHNLISNFIINNWIITNSIIKILELSN